MIWKERTEEKRVGGLLKARREVQLESYRSALGCVDPLLSAERAKMDIDGSLGAHHLALKCNARIKTEAGKLDESAHSLPTGATQKKSLVGFPQDSRADEWWMQNPAQKGEPTRLGTCPYKEN